MTRVRLPAALAAAALLAVATAVAGGCGGGGASGPTHAQYAARAERACATARGELRAPIAALAAAAGDLARLTPARERRLVSHVREVEAAGVRLLRRLRALDVPSADREAAGRLTDGVAALDRAVGQAGDALAAGRTTAALAGLAAAGRRSAEARQAAEDLGLRVCAAAVAPL